MGTCPRCVLPIQTITKRYQTFKRDSAAIILLVKGVHPKAVQELLGHSNIGVTMDVYSHALPSMLQAVTDKMNDIFKRL